MDRKTRDRLKLKRSTKFGVPGVVGLKQDASGALRLGRSQIEAGNRFAQEEAKVGAVFGADGKPVMNRNQKKKYMKALNKQRADLGQPPLVNFDGGYGDET